MSSGILPIGSALLKGGDVVLHNLADLTLECTPGIYQGGPPGGPPAYFPHADWRRTRSVTPSPVATQQPASPLSRAVTTVCVGPDAVELARRRLLPALSGGAVEERRAALEHVRTSIENLLSRNYGIRCRERGPADCVVNRPGLISTAFDFDSGHFVGLHIDNHQRFPVHRRDSSQILFAVNIGFSHRYLIFAPWTVRGMLSRLGKPTESRSEDTDSVSLKEEYLSAFPREPLFRIRLEPGDAYLCAPQNLIHDGATNDSGSADVALLMSGDYAWSQSR
ncbi:hypothetical protein GCM10023347_40510 [Streptomyces chumphonensis]|uniref:Uncharacterized protein n=1 Tax=Streptomyces chumphonensis TaxID=1214925 RepID=A0A927IA17_9ACTN|nr:hypothetical protein [Streptomyces chumphonensis]MBD3930433.1 hypothetical protein [Streptomyces chumphonensis]